jgi:hypothetical protein
MTSKQHKDVSTGKIFEVLTFDNKRQEVYYSEDLHRINFICNEYGLDPEIHKDFKTAVKHFKN